LGGTGVALPWSELSGYLAPWRAGLPLVLAGGLRPENVGMAIGALSPSVVDVSSGIESAPGIKDHQRMEAFCDAVHGLRASAGRSVSAP
jgi:phosphoribosylanthranilate isomerase